MHKIKILFSAVFLALSATWAMAQSEYTVRTGDTIVIEVLEDTSLNRSLVVLSDGRINFPFAGNIQVRGRTVGEIEAAITAGIASNFVSEPNVFVSVQPAPVIAAAPVPEAPPPVMEIYFLGEVNNPGVVQMEPGTRFLQAIAQSGGLTRFAADKRVQLRRTDDRTGEVYTFEINYRAILDGAEISNNIRLEDGDVIVVPERRLFE